MYVSGSSSDAYPTDHGWVASARAHLRTRLQYLRNQWTHPAEIWRIVRDSLTIFLYNSWDEDICASARATAYPLKEQWLAPPRSWPKKFVTVENICIPVSGVQGSLEITSSGALTCYITL